MLNPVARIDLRQLPLEASPLEDEMRADLAPRGFAGKRLAKLLC